MRVVCVPSFTHLPTCAMSYPSLNPTERAVLSVIEEKGTVDQHDLLAVLDPELGIYYVNDVLETLYALNLIQEVDIGRFSLRSVLEAA